MKWQNVGIVGGIDSESSTGYLQGHSAALREIIRRQTELLINKMSDMDIPDKLFIKIDIMDTDPDPTRPFTGHDPLTSLM